MSRAELGQFQDDFVQALWALPDAPANALPPGLRALASQPGFAVYRNTVLKGCIDALQANHPAIARLVGEEWFRAAAAVHVRQHPPQDTRMLLYGQGFADFLQGFAPAADLPYLSGVARLERFWTEAHCADDACVLAPSALAGLPPQQLGARVLEPHPATRWAWFDAQPIYTLWQRNRASELDSTQDDDELVWAGEGALLTRPAGSVVWTPLAAAGCAFLDACAAGKPLADAAGEALARQADCDLTQLMATLLAAGAFCSAHDSSAHPPLIQEPS